jgi:predicted enzyme related to lactoylglutathione lyase
MNPLLYVIVYTSDVGRMRAFYKDQLGLETGEDAAPHWVDFQTAGAALALHPTGNGKDRQIELAFGVDDIVAAERTLRARGVTLEAGVTEQPWGRYLALRDPEGNRIGLMSPHEPMAPREGPALRTMILNVGDLAAATAFYRDRLALPVARAEAHWIELDTGGTRVALHARPGGADHPLHAASKVAPCFEADDLVAWSETLRERGVEFATSPTDEEFGFYAEVLDPDGNLLVFREPLSAPALEETLAAPFEDGEITHPIGMRRRATKLAKAVSRVAVRPEYRPRKPAAKKPLSATTQAVVSVRGAGPNHARLKPRKTGDEKKAKVKPMQGKRRKATTERAARQRTAGARAGKSKPVKRASASRGRRK